MDNSESHTKPLLSHTSSNDSEDLENASRSDVMESKEIIIDVDSGSVQNPHKEVSPEERIRNEDLLVQEDDDKTEYQSQQSNPLIKDNNAMKETESIAREATKEQDSESKDKNNVEEGENKRSPDESEADRQDNSEDEGSSATSVSSGYRSRMLTDSESQFESVVRTLKHYRRRRRRRNSSGNNSIDSNCSCSSCSSSKSIPYFGSPEGPPGGENTVYRRACLWLEGIKFMYGILAWGAILMTGLFAGFASYAYQSDKEEEKRQGLLMMKWSIPALIICLIIFLVWRMIWHVLVWKGYLEGEQIVCRKHIIEFAQKKELVYSIRGAVYAGVRPNSEDPKKPDEYEVVSYDDEYDSTKYFDSDLDAEGNYKMDIKPYRECQDPWEREKRHIYSKRAWHRDVPVVWWEMWNAPPKNY